MELISREQTQKYIQAINKDAVHQICSGQVVLNLATAVKELVENSLDAGATVIEIRLKEYGSELVEVIDNGSGVEESNFEGLTLKHHTSKLREFSDLVSVETFGFRGEALSSLCALSEMSVITRHSSASCGTKLEFDYKGHIVKKKSCARQIGTTISLQNLFSPLPVRQKEFLRNVHREFAKMTQLLYAYCLVSTGTKISCSNQNKKGGRTVVVTTLGSETVRENIASVFGTKQVQCLVEFLQKSPNETMLQEYGIPELLAPPENPFQLEGCISSCAHGQGRSATDRQFFYVNNRPCEPKKVIKIVNEVYHQFNQHQYPFVFLNLKTERNCVDVNVTPDKRQVFLDQEKLLIATIKASLIHMYETIPSSFNFQNVSHNLVPQIPSSSQTGTRVVGSLTDIFKKWSHSPGKDHSFSPTKHGKGIKRGLDSASSGKSKLHRIDHFFSLKKEEINKELLTEVEISNENILNVIEISSSSQYEQETKSTEITNVESSDDMPNDVEIINDVLPDYAEVKNDKCIQNSYEEIHNLKEVKCINSGTATNYNQTNEHSIIINEEIVKDSSVITEIGDTDIKDTAIQKFQDELTDSLEHEVKITNDDDDKLIIMTDEEKGVDVKRKIVHMSVSIDSIKQELESKRRNKKNDNLPVVRFRAEIDPSKNKSAESELRKEISKDMFAKMETLGQFNLGFIVTRLDSDLFIIDQHATDEKYNFEMLQLNTILQNQKLVIPQKLELTAVNESILIENEEIFRKNGFDFIIDQNAEPTKRVQLTSIPISKNWEFGKEDIDELLFMLQDSPHTMCRPSRVRAMFASRACRKSIMIGTALSKADMRRLVDHMGMIEQPWNCPHGRPTMRHLVNLDLIHNG